MKFKMLNKKLNTEQDEYNPINDSIEFGRFDWLRESLLDDLPQPTHSVVWAYTQVIAKKSCQL